MTTIYNFPFNTCEKVRSPIAQPYSAFINLITCLILIYFIVKTKSMYSFAFLFSFLLFQMMHLVSHCIHIAGNIQQISIHYLAILTNICFYVLYTVSSKRNSYALTLAFVFINLLDLYMLFENYPFVYTVFTQLFVFILLLFSFFEILPLAKQNHIQLLLLSSFSVGVLLINEKTNGNKLLEWWPDFPFHVFIELVGLVAIYLIATLFYDIEQPKV